MSPVPPNASMGVMESPSRYPAPAVPVVLSAVSSEQVSPGRDREVSSSVTLDVFPVYENSLDTSILEGHVASLGSGVYPAGSSGISG